MIMKVLLSYHYYKKTKFDRMVERGFAGIPPLIFADSGAFSSLTQGAVITVDEYAGWVKKWHKYFAYYANLDVIGNPDATYQNQIMLEEMGLKPLPVFHVGEDFKWLDMYLEKYNYICLGGMVPYMRQQKQIMPWLIKCFKRARGRAVFHGFGATAWTVIAALPWYSVDSSSWGQGFRYGTVPIFNSRTGGFKKIQLGNWEDWKAHKKLVGELGFDWRRFADREKNTRELLCAVAAVSYMKAEEFLRARHGEIMIPNNTNPPGVNLYLVDSNQSNLRDAFAGIRIHLADTTNELEDIRRARSYISGKQ